MRGIKNDGGHAFPRDGVKDGYGKIVGAQGGMSLRDWFAGQALAGMCGHPRALSQVQDGDLLSDAKLMYRFADAMIAARDA